MARLFVAVWPPDDLAEDLRGLPRKERPGIRWIAPENWHVTLRFLGDADAEEVAARLHDATLPVADATYGPGVDVMWKRTIVVPVAGLDGLAAAVAAATADVGEPPGKRFVGHLTIGRIRRGGRVPPAVVGAPVRAEQRVEDLALVTSTLRPEGAAYDVVATWPTR